MQHRGTASAHISLIEIDVGHPRGEAHIHPSLQQPALQRPDQGVILVVLGAHHARQRMNARKLLNEAQEIALQFDRAVPILEGKGGAPHLPEIGLEEMLGE